MPVERTLVKENARRERGRRAFALAATL